MNTNYRMKTQNVINEALDGGSVEIKNGVYLVSKSTLLDLVTESEEVGSLDMYRIKRANDNSLFIHTNNGYVEQVDEGDVLMMLAESDA